jgi:16S rRNA (uracil1498-N3)-methyltransferase
VVAGACEQCGRSVLPAMQPPLDLQRYLAVPHGEGLRLVLSPDTATSVAALAGRLDGVAAGVELLIGPEGGLEDAEVAAAIRAGYLPAGLGPRVLRTETAGVAALAVLQALAGDLG